MWMVKNPHLKKKGTDEDIDQKHKDEDYKKTFIWSKPPKAIVGTMIMKTDGSISYGGDFATADKPNGKPAKDLDEDDKKILKRRFDEERKQADSLHEELKQKNKEIGFRCTDPTLRSGHFALASLPHNPGPAASSLHSIPVLTDFPSAGFPETPNGNSRTYVAPVAGPGATLTGTVIGDQPGPTAFYVATVDAQGKKKFLQGLTDVAGRFVLAIPDIVSLTVFQRSKDGQPTDGASCSFTTTPHLDRLQMLANAPAHGPAIIDANPVYERGGASGGLIRLQTRATAPDARIIMDGTDKDVETLATSDESVLGRLRSSASLGPHELRVISGRVASNSFRAIVATLTFEPAAPMKPGQTRTIRLHVAGPSPEDKPSVTFTVAGAAKLAGSQPAVTAPVVDGIATVTIVATGTGGFQLNATLNIASPQFKQ
jgi:hypothetical protein